LGNWPLSTLPIQLASEGVHRSFCCKVSPNISGKHTTWWTKVFGSGLQDVQIFHRAGKLSSHVDALSRNPYGPAPLVGIGELEVQVASVAECEPDQVEEYNDLSTYISIEPVNSDIKPEMFAVEQRKHDQIATMGEWILIKHPQEETGVTENYQGHGMAPTESLV